MGNVVDFGNLLVDPGFQEEGTWTEVVAADFSGSSVVRRDWGIYGGRPKPGSPSEEYGYVVNNLFHASVVSPPVSVAEGETFSISGWTRGEVDQGDSLGSSGLRVREYKNTGPGGTPKWASEASIPLDSQDDSELTRGSWLRRSGSYTVPEGVDAISVFWAAHNLDGWVAVDDVSWTRASTVSETTVHYTLGGVSVGYRQGDTLHVTTSDVVDSVTSSFDVDEGRVSREYYAPYGETLDGLYGMDRGYTNQTEDPTTGLLHYGARYYDPSTRTFTSPDVLVPDPYWTQSYNRYAYVGNNPITYSDPTGRIPIPGNDLPAGDNPDVPDDYTGGGGRGPGAGPPGGSSGGGWSVCSLLVCSDGAGRSIGFVGGVDDSIIDSAGDMRKKVAGVCEAAGRAGLPDPFCYGTYWENPASVPEAAFHLDRCAAFVVLCGYDQRTEGLARQLQHASVIVAHSQGGFALSFVIDELPAEKHVILVDVSGAMNDEFEEFIARGGEVTVLSTDSLVTGYADWDGGSLSNVGIPEEHQRGNHGP